MNVKPFDRSVASITTAYNAAAALRQHIDALLRQERPLQEIIVVDNASSDETRSLLAAQYPQVTVLRMTENLGAGRPEVKPGEFDRAAPDNVSPLVVWLGSPESREITGRVFLVSGGAIGVAEGWHRGPTIDKGDRWEPRELGGVVPDLVAKAASNATMRT